MPATFAFGLFEVLRPDEDQREAAYLSFLGLVSQTLDPPVLREFYDGLTFVDGGDRKLIAEARDGIVEKREVAAGEAPKQLGADIPRGTLEKLVGQVNVILSGGQAESEVVVPAEIDHEDVDNPLQCISTVEARRRINIHTGLDEHDRRYADLLLALCREADQLKVAIALSWL